MGRSSAATYSGEPGLTHRDDEMCCRALVAVVCLNILSGAPASAEKKNTGPAPASFQKQIPKNQRIEHALNRLTFGPRPGDLERVRSMGLKKWVDQQLHPGRIAENPVLLEKLKALNSLSMSSQDLV